MKKLCGNCGTLDRSVCARCSKEHSGWSPKPVVGVEERLGRSEWIQLLNPRTGHYVKIRLFDAKVVHKKSMGMFKNIPLYIRGKLVSEKVMCEFLPEGMIEPYVGKFVGGEVDE